MGTRGKADIVRFDEARFALLFPPLSENELTALIESLRSFVKEQSFRHRRRRFTFDFVVAGTAFMAGEPFTLILDKLEDQLFDKHPS